MARKGGGKGKKGSTRAIQPDSAPTSTDGLTMTLPDMRVQKAQDEKEAKRRLKEADAKLKELEKRQSRRVRKQIRKERAREKKLKRRERARARKAVLPLVAVVIPHAVASAMLILDMLWPEIVLYEPLLYAESVHWEVVILSYAVSLIATIGLILEAPSRQFHERARRGLFVYLALGFITIAMGALLVYVLEPMEGYSVDWTTAIWVLLIALAASGIPMPITFLAAHLGTSRLFYRPAYHWVMGILTAVFVIATFLLPLFFIASEGWILEAGLILMLAGGLGVFFSGTGAAAYVLGGDLGRGGTVVSS
jgi:hypothetical protein